MSIPRFIEVQIVCLTAAMPPDVRQVSDLLGNTAWRFRAAPALRGIAPICWNGDSREAAGLPHIERRSRNKPGCDSRKAAGLPHIERRSRNKPGCDSRKAA